MCSKYWILFLLFGLLSYNNNKGLNSVLCQSTKSNQMSYYFTPICMFISIFACLKTMTIQSLQQEVLKIQLFYIRASILSLQYVSHMYFHIFCQTFSSHSKNSLCRWWNHLYNSIWNLKKSADWLCCVYSGIKQMVNSTYLIFQPNFPQIYFFYGGWAVLETLDYLIN